MKAIRATVKGGEVVFRDVPLDLIPGFMQATALGQSAVEVMVFRSSVPIAEFLLRGGKILAASTPPGPIILDRVSMRKILSDVLATTEPENTYATAWTDVRDYSRLQPIDTIDAAILACAPRDVEGTAIPLDNDEALAALNPYNDGHTDPAPDVLDADTPPLQMLGVDVPSAVPVEPTRAVEVVVLTPRMDVWRGAVTVLAAMTAGVIGHYALMCYRILGDTTTILLAGASAGLLALSAWFLKR